MLDFQGSWVEHLPLINLRIITVSRAVLGWHHMNLFMEGHVDRLCAELN